MAEEQVRAHVWVAGMVQMVSYRAYTVRQAHKLGINGWVRNLPDGRVEAVFEGSPEAVQRMVQWCYQGSPAAVVEGVAVEMGKGAGIRGFTII